MTRKHIWSVLEDECQHIVFRFQGKVGRRLQNMCENLMDDHDEEMAEAFRGKSFGEKYLWQEWRKFLQKAKRTVEWKRFSLHAGPRFSKREKRFVGMLNIKKVFLLEIYLGFLLFSKRKKFAQLS